MGVVYEVEDRDRAQHVALKTLKTPDPETLYRLKWEFRSLAEFRHPNVLQLYELIVAEEQCLLTMERVEGVNLLTYVDATAVQPREAYHARLREVFAQLGQALLALHRAGKVHRDVKPENVLVTHDGRVVLLDFGLVTAFEGAEESEGIVGTVDYMAPEQALDPAGVTAAADWYAVGVMLFRALTGQLPFTGSAGEILEAKATRAVPSVADLAPDAAADLAALCAELLVPEPAKRPAGERILARLDGTRSSAAVRGPAAAELTGRARELDQLHAAFARVLDTKRPGVLVLSGAAGLGKTILARTFLRRAQEELSSVMVLEGRCYEREDLPYKAMDSLVDRLSGQWLSLPDAEAEAILPLEPGLLPVIFPVLGRVPQVADAPRLSGAEDPQLRRTRAFEALRQVFQRLGQRRPLIMLLDDMQWVDEGTMLLLSDLMRPPDPPCLLLLLMSRPEGAAPLSELVAPMAARVEEIMLRPFDEDEAMELARQVLEDSSASVVRRIVRGARGNPFFVRELADYARHSGRTELEDMGLEQLLEAKLAQLPGRSRQLLRLLAEAAEPLTRRVIGSALDVSDAELRHSIDGLRDARLVHTTGEKASDGVEIFHALIRSTVSASLSNQERRQGHRSIAMALERWSDGSQEQLVRHWLGAGEPQRAAERAKLAASEAMSAFDFDRAARLSRIALDVGSFDAAEKQQLAIAHAESLSYAGKPAEAAQAFDHAAQGLSQVERHEMTRRAVEQLLRGGYVDEGFRRLHALLDEVGVRIVKKSAFWSVLLALVFRLVILLRGRRTKERSAAQVPPAQLTRVDSLYSVTVGLYAIDILRAAEVEGRFILAALVTGEPRRVACAFGIEALRAAITGNDRRALAYGAAGLALSERTDYATARFLAVFAHGAVDYYCTNKWRRALDTFREVESTFVKSGGGSGWEVNNSQIFSMWCLLYLGDLVELSRRVPQLVREAQRRGDRYAEVCIRTRFVALALARNEPDEALREVNDAVASWLQTQRFLIPHFYAMHSRCEIALYRRDADSARAELERNRSGLFWSLTTTIPMVKIEVIALDARISLLECEQGRPAFRRAASAARALARLRPPIGKALGLLTRATLAKLAGDLPRARSELERAISAFEADETLLYAQVARRRLGELSGNTSLIEQSETWMRARSIIDCASIAAMLAPGWGSPRESAAKEQP